MSRIDLPESFAVSNLRQWVKDSLMSHGEECVLLSMYHVARDAGVITRCPVCFDSVYSSTSSAACTDCWGTSFHRGVRQLARAWGLFTDSDNDETFMRQGVWANSNRQLQTEHTPELWQHDFVARVRRWSRDHRPQEIEGIYVCAVVDPISLRTGNQHGDTERDLVGQRTAINRAPDDHVMYRFPLVGKVIDRADGKER